MSQDLDNDSDPEEDGIVTNRMSSKNKKHQIFDSSDEEESGSVSIFKNKNTGEKNAKGKMWSEEEVVSLTQLYLEHKDSDDVISTIVKDLPFKTTKKSIVEKLLETGLIKDKREIKNLIPVKRKKLPDVWEEEEVLELTRLFQNNIGSSDIMSNILQGLTVKRQKKKVVEKMLELGLIQDKKEIGKKKASRSGAMRGKDEDEQKRTLKPKELSANRKKRNTKIVSSDESEDDMLPLSQMLAKDDSENFPHSQSYSQISLQERISNLTKSLKEVRENAEADHRSDGVQNVKDVKTKKRKRHLIMSDDSSDDDVTSSTPVDDPTKEGEILIINPTEQYLNDLDSVKSLKKKRICVLDDSEDSS